MKTGKSKSKLKSYKVQVFRLLSLYGTVVVKASSKKEAKRLALENSGDIVDWEGASVDGGEEAGRVELLD